MTHPLSTGMGQTLAGVLLAALVAGCGRDSAPTPVSAAAPGTLAVVGSEVITEADFRMRWQYSMPGPDNAANRQQVLDDMIERAAMVDTARREGLERDPEIAGEIERLLIARLREKRLKSQVQSLRVGEEDMRAYFEQNKAKFTQAGRARVAVLWFDTQGQEPLVERFRPRLQAVRDQVTANPADFPVEAGFGALAVANSEHRASRYQGGDIGWLIESGNAGEGFDAGEWSAAIRGIAQSLSEPGALSDVVELPEGMFLVRLIDRKPEAVADFDDMKDRIRHAMLAEQRKALEERFQEDVLSGVTVQRYPEAMASLSGLNASPALTSNVNTFTPGAETQP